MYDTDTCVVTRGGWGRCSSWLNWPQTVPHGSSSSHASILIMIGKIQTIFAEFGIKLIRMLSCYYVSARLADMAHSIMLSSLLVVVQWSREGLLGSRARAGLHSGCQDAIQSILCCAAPATPATCNVNHAAYCCGRLAKNANC